MKIINWQLVWEFVATLVIPLLYFENIVIIVKYPDTIKNTYFFIFLGILLAILGLLFWIFSYIHLGKSFGVMPKEQKRVKSGLYHYFKHPMYIGIWLTFLGLSIANSSAMGLLYLNLIIAPLLFIRSYFEEKNLKN